MTPELTPPPFDPELAGTLIAILEFIPRRAAPDFVALLREQSELLPPGHG